MLNKLTVKELKEITKMFEKEKDLKGMKKSDLILHIEHLQKNGKVKAKHAGNEDKLRGGAFLDFFRSIKTELNNTSKKTLKQYGNMKIIRLQVIRTPIMKVLDKVINFISFGKWSTLKKKYNYDQLFHLGLLATLQTASGQKLIILEKNEVININSSTSLGAKSEFVEVPLSKELTLNELWQNTASKYPPKQLYLYDGIKNNCQNFILMLLDANGLNNASLQAFIKQPLEELAKKLPGYIRPVMNTVTDLGARVNQAIGGAKLDVSATLKAQNAEAQAKKQTASTLTRGQQLDIAEAKQKRATVGNTKSPAPVNIFQQENAKLKSQLNQKTNDDNKQFREEAKAKRTKKANDWNELYKFLEDVGYDRNSGETVEEFEKRYADLTGQFKGWDDKQKKWKWYKNQSWNDQLHDMPLVGDITNAIDDGLEKIIKVRPLEAFSGIMQNDPKSGKTREEIAAINEQLRAQKGGGLFGGSEDDKIYFGAGPLPDFHRRPTMLEAVAANQVRYFGINKIDAVTLKQTGAKKQSSKAIEKKIQDAQLKFVELGGTIKKLTRSIPTLKDAKEKKKVEKQLEKAKNDKIKLSDKIKTLKNQMKKK